ALYRNDGTGHFDDVTRAAGLDLEFYGMGAVAGDVDNDSHVDLFLTGLGESHLFLNRGDGTFRDATATSGLNQAGWGTMAAFLDYDRDGDLGLFVCNYVKWTPRTDLWCTLDGQHKSYCPPESYEGERSRLYRNDGKGVFTDVSEAAGILKGKGKALGVAVFGFDAAGWAGIAGAHDTPPHPLFSNRRRGAFAEGGGGDGGRCHERGGAAGA